MANVFKQVTEPSNKVDTSYFDLSFQNNLTMQFGYLYPCFVKKFAPKTSVKIKPTFGLNFMPMMFPVQTRMRARMSFYKVRCRSLWKDYKDWFGNLKPNLEKPYIDFNSDEKLKHMASTGSLGDYLGLPTTFPREMSSESLTLPTLPSTKHGSFVNILSPIASSSGYTYSPETLPDFVALNDQGILTQQGGYNFLSYIHFPTPYKEFDTLSGSVTFKLGGHSGVLNQSLIYDKVPASLNFGAFLNGLKKLFSNFVIIKNPGDATPSRTLTPIPSDSIEVNVSTTEDSISVFFKVSKPGLSSSDGKICWAVPAFISYEFGSDPSEVLVGAYSTLVSASKKFFFLPTATSANTFCFVIPKDSSPSKFEYDLSWSNTLGASSSSELTLSTSPYYNSGSQNNMNQLKIDASFFRAYEAIYNAYFRDIRNNPFMLNGQPEYNTFIPTDEGGSDDNIYKLRRRNWEADFLTTAVPSPQQGRAPLVGITNYNDTTNLAFTAEDGKKYAVTFDYDKESEELKDVAFKELGDDAVVREARNMMDLVSSGISISDLRNVNAYTKFLELNMRKGYFYKDLVEGHFDTKVRYDELNMPEFIGGTAKDVFVNPVSQTVQTSQDGSYFGALGSYAGQASVSGQADNTISAYFDEETIVIGLISIVPVANYSQLLPKHFLHRELLDSYFPEFDNIGFQPIYYNEVCPIQAYNDDPATLSETFGYQRPWYDYVASTDEVHGLFRTNLRNFLINRVFSSKPTLSEDFLLVDPEQVNDVFSVTQTTDKILGQIWFDVQVKAPISRVAIPRLD